MLKYDANISSLINMKSNLITYKHLVTSVNKVVKQWWWTKIEII